MEDVQFTHYAWLGVCPLYLYEDEEELVVEARHWIFEPLWYLSVAFFVIFSLPLTILNGGVQEAIPFLITGTIE